jgi:DNA uptake protein ComE-like DNA-binding protein
MIRSFTVRSLSVLALAMILPVAALAVQSTAKSAAPAHMAHAKRMPAVDINSASKEDLMKLPGVSEELAQKIIDSRPYKTKGDLTKKQILTKAEYGKVRSHIVARQEAKTTEAK